MVFRITADLVLLLHLAFIAFVVLGGLLAFRYRWIVYLHVPAAAWGAFIEISGRICPLTILENSLRRSAGESGYAESFVEHYLMPVIYPPGLNRNVQFTIAGIVVVANIVIYGWLLYRSGNHRRSCRGSHESDIGRVARRRSNPARIERDQNGLSGNSTIRAVTRDDATAISALAIRSKAHWGYSDEFMKACREELTYTESQIESTDYEFYVCEAEGKIAGFYALEILGNNDAELEALFVEPEMIGRGFGRTLIEHAKLRAIDLGVRRIVIQGDPHAQAFYEAAGGVRDGRRESGSIPGRFLPVYRIEIGNIDGD